MVFASGAVSVSESAVPPMGRTRAQQPLSAALPAGTKMLAEDDEKNGPYD